MTELEIMGAAIESSNVGHGFKPFAECVNTFQVFDGAVKVGEFKQSVGFGDATAALMLAEADGHAVKGFSLCEYFDNSDGEDEPDERVWGLQVSEESWAGDAETLFAEFIDYRICLRAAQKDPADAFFARTLASAAAGLQTALAQLPTSAAEQAALKLANEWFEAGRE